MKGQMQKVNGHWLIQEPLKKWREQSKTYLEILEISNDLWQEIGRKWDEILVSSNDSRFSCR